MSVVARIYAQVENGALYPIAAAEADTYEDITGELVTVFQDLAIHVENDGGVFLEGMLGMT